LVESIGLSEAQVVACYGEAVEWAEEALRSIA
jgi:hypothetical protein